MNKICVTMRKLLAAFTVLACSGATQAALLDRGGGMIYDTELNITWLQDWNYAKTSGYTWTGVYPEGYMLFSAANKWAQDLVFGGFDDWRLPTAVDTYFPGCDFSNSGGTDCGYNVQTKAGGRIFSEMAHMFYNTLSNKAFCEVGYSVCREQAGWGLKNTGPFINVQDAIYAINLTVPGPVSIFFMSHGYQYIGIQEECCSLYAVAVRDGDVAAVPESKTWALMLFGLGALLMATKKRAA
jgi:hypothetical protein